MKRILVIAAHPDDEVLGCGGTMARLAREGQEVHTAIFGEGITSRYQRRESADAALLDSLRASCSAVADILGSKEPVLYGLPDNRFDTVPLLDIVKQVEELVSRVEPETIFTHHGGDLNIDHVILHRAVLTATRLMNHTPVRSLYAFEVPSSSDWAFGQFAPGFRPDLFYDIGASLEAKLRAMQVYESEARAFPHPRSPEALEAIARRWGSVVGTAAAEAFEVIRELR